MKTGTIQSLIDVLEQAFENLGLVILARELESLAITVHKAMSVEGRHYHTPEHVLSLSDAHNPIQTLAALFHDIVYYQVDQGFSPEALVAIAPFTYLDGLQEGKLVLRDPEALDDFYFKAATQIFGFRGGQNLFTTEAFNEFLSTLVMVNKLRSLLPSAVILQVVVYIEATIPFREETVKGKSPFRILEERLQQVCQRHVVPMTDAEIEKVIQGAVAFANKDVENFADKDPAVFLSSTWKLLPEVNLALRSARLYLIRDYRQALQRMYDFLSTLHAESVFHSYHGIPPAEELEEMLKYTRINMETARQYLDIKLLTIAILEALAQVTGGDAPLSLFLGESEEGLENAHQLDDYLPDATIHSLIDKDSRIYHLLTTSADTLTDLADLKDSRLTLYIYQTLGPSRVAQHLENARRMFNGDLDSDQFLESVDSGLLGDIAQACAFLVPTRSDKLIRYAQAHSG